MDTVSDHRRRLVLTVWVTAALVPCGGVSAQDASPLNRVRELGLDSAQVGQVSAYFAGEDREFATELAVLSAAATTFFEAEFKSTFPLNLAVLRPDAWFVPYDGGDFEPYGIPWAWIPSSLVTVPASRTEGALIQGPDETADVRRISFIMLHETGHVAAKRLLHPSGGRDYSAARWFEEFLSTYFAYAYVATHDQEWARAMVREWDETVRSASPPSATLDWSQLNQLPPEEFASTYEWYQQLLGLRAAAVHANHGLAFLHAVRSVLDWDESDDWTAEFLVSRLDVMAPGFEAWAEGLGRGVYTDLLSR